jgi:hypothetical protein
MRNTSSFSAPNQVQRRRESRQRFTAPSPLSSQIAIGNVDDTLKLSKQTTIAQAQGHIPDDTAKLPPPTHIIYQGISAAMDTTPIMRRQSFASRFVLRPRTSERSADSISTDRSGNDSSVSERRRSQVSSRKISYDPESQGSLSKKLLDDATSALRRSKTLSHKRPVYPDVEGGSIRSETSSTVPSSADNEILRKLVGNGACCYVIMMINVSLLRIIIKNTGLSGFPMKKSGPDPIEYYYVHVIILLTVIIMIIII